MILNILDTNEHTTKKKRLSALIFSFSANRTYWIRVLRGILWTGGLSVFMYVTKNSVSLQFSVDGWFRPLLCKRSTRVWWFTVWDCYWRYCCRFHIILRTWRCRVGFSWLISPPLFAFFLFSCGSPRAALVVDTPPVVTKGFSLLPLRRKELQAEFRGLFVGSGTFRALSKTHGHRLYTNFYLVRHYWISAL